MSRGRRLAGLAFALALLPLAASAIPRFGTAVVFGEPGARIAGGAFRTPTISAHPHLVVVLHGDSPSTPPAYHYAFARLLTARAHDTISVALLRPGYSDPVGRRSEGPKGRSTGDNYTPEALAALAAAITEAKARYAVRDVTLIGHSGGAVLAADLMTTRPGLAGRAVLVACPCDVPPWRVHMARKNWNLLFRLPVRSLAPDAGGLARTTRIQMLTGADDRVAPVQFSAPFAAAAKRRGIDATLIVLPGVGHDILLTGA